MSKNIPKLITGRRRPQIQETGRTPTKINTKNNSNWHIYSAFKNPNTKSKSWNDLDWGGNLTYKAKIRITEDFSSVDMAVRISGLK